MAVAAGYRCAAQHRCGPVFAGIFATTVCAVLGFCGAAWAQTAAPAGLEPPELVTRTTIDYPTGAPAHDDPITVRVQAKVGADGKVATVTIVGAPQPPFDAAVIAGIKRFGFSPARYKGRPVAVIIPYAHTFLPPAPKIERISKDGPALACELSGRLREKGTRVPVQRVTVAVHVAGHTVSTLSTTKGRFKLKVPCGSARVTVHGRGYLAFLQREMLAENQRLAVAYMVERERYDPYEIVIYGEQRRTEIARTSLRGKEMTQVPGTFGDPFRVIQTLPGVASVMGLLPFPIVRGASPGSTGFLIDRVRVPLLFHLLAGPSVIHPDFLDQVDFYAGGFPVPYGGYTAGIVDGRTRRSTGGERLLDFNLNLLQSGVLVRTPIPGTTMTLTAAGRVGYPGIIISLATDEASLSYWDYQLRLDGGTPRNGFTVFAFGAADEVMGRPADADPTDRDVDLVTVLRLSFHRLDLRYLHGKGKLDSQYRMVLGVDDTIAAGSGGVRTLIAGPLLKWRYRVDKQLQVVAGIEGSARDTGQQGGTSVNSNEPDIGSFTEDLSRFYVASTWLEALWRPTDDLLLRPGIRGDLRNDGQTTVAAGDPRLTFRYRLGAPLPAGVTLTGTIRERDDDALWLKGGVGLYHQPPRFFLPIPGLDQMPLRYGLLAAVQTMIGIEAPLGAGISIETQVFYNDMDPVIFDLSVNQALTDVQVQAPTFEGGKDPGDRPDQQTGADNVLDKLLTPQRGRAYGLEMLIRRRSRKGVYGWLSYTLSLSERFKDQQWAPFDFDRRHLLNLVAGVPLPRHWEIGARLQFQSGKPTTTTYGYNAGRIDGFLRIDVRIDKRAVWNDWLLDFYVDVTNIALFPEEISAGQILRYVLPTVGFRGRL